jgi:putative NADPH-quinone reductase
MPKRILIIDGHPDPEAGHYIHAMAAAYRDGARAAGHEVQAVAVSELEFPLLRKNEDFQHGHPPDAIRTCQAAVRWADHLVILFPLWLGSMPALLKGFLEQLMRPGFAFAAAERNGFPRKLLKGKSARIIVSMGMPAFFYRWYFRAHSLKSLERNILAFCGIGPIRASVIGMVDAMGQEKRGRWLARVQELGRRAR